MRSPTPDRAVCTLGYRIGIPGTYSSVEMSMTFESSMREEDGGDPKALFLRVRRTAERALEAERKRRFTELGLDSGASPREKGRVRWAST